VRAEALPIYKLPLYKLKDNLPITSQASGVTILCSP
jgi:hypothetical protein